MNSDLLPFLSGEIRTSSAEGRLTNTRELAEAGSRHFASPLTEEEVSGALRKAGEEKGIGILSGSATERYYMREVMADSYAQTLNAVAEKNIPELIAMTVRRESKVYPRPTIISQFLLPPCSLDQEQLEAAVALVVESTGDYGDIRQTAASNGDRYLFSDSALSAARAGYLAEWLSVEQMECQ